MHFLRKSFLFLFGLIFVGSFFFIHAHATHALTSIASCADLQNIANDLNEEYVLANTIDCTGFPFTPIGIFTGTLDGNSYAIQNLSITGFVNDHALFSDTDGATIKNLTISNANIQGNYQAAILAAVATDTTINNVHIDGVLHANAALSLAGAFAGRMSGGIITRSSADVIITGYEFVGGLVGSLTDDGIIKKSSAIGTITTLTTGSNSTTGGLVGEFTSGQILNSYTNIAVSAQGDIVGGLVGSSEGTALVYHSYAAGTVSSALGATDISGLIGREINDATSVDSYWDIDTSLQTNSASGTGKTTVQMQDEDTFETWDFIRVWDISPNDYPTFLPNDPAIPTLTEIQAISPQTRASDALYFFSASEDGEYLFSPCGADVYLNSVVGEVSFDSLIVGTTYSCSFVMVDDDGNTSNQLTIGPFTVIRSGATRGGVTRSRAIIGKLLTHQKSKKDTFFSSRTLRLGSIGEEVRALQIFLNTHGFPVAQEGKGSLGNETIFFGPKTKNALMKFQEANSTSILAPLGLTTATGILGEQTKRVMNAY